MNLRIRAVSLFALSAAVVAFGAIPSSYAASSAKPKAPSKASAKSKAPAKAKAKAKPKASKLPSPPAGNDGRAGFGGDLFAQVTAKQRACLVKHGVKLPEPSANGKPPTAAPRPSGARPTPAPNGSRPPREFGNGGLFNDPKTQAAFKNCGVKIASPGVGGAFDPAKFQAFEKCMTKAGFTSTGGFGRYDQSDPSTVAALVKCQKKTGFTLPNRGQPGSGQ